MSQIAGQIKTISEVVRLENIEIGVSQAESRLNQSPSFDRPYLMKLTLRAKIKLF